MATTPQGKLGRAVLVAAAVLLALAAGASGVRCPAKCLCFRTTVRCMFLQLEKIPKVPPETTILDLRFNRIKSIPPNTFRDLGRLHTLLLNNNHITRLENGSFTGLRDLRYLYLYKNRIRLIESRVFQHLDKLEQLYLHFNDLATFDADTFSNLTSLERLFLHNNRLQRVPDGAFRNLHSLRRLRLDSNALVCDCQLLWLAEMVKEKQHRTQVAATCQFPSDLQGKSLTSLADSHFECRGKPQIKEGPTDVDVKFGGTAYFTCKVEGDPQPEVIWLHNNEVITADDRYNILTDGTLMIENTQDGDVGFYECMASNPMGEVKSRKAKMVHPEQQQQLQQYLQHQLRQQLHQQLRERQQQQQPRERQVQQPEQQPQQERQQQERQQQPQQERQQERQQQQQQQQGHHHGQHPGSQSQQVESTNQAIVPAKPRFVRLPSDVNVTVGSPVQMECEVTGRPRPDITWSRGDDLVEEGPRIQISNRGALTISSAVPSDAATYLCTAANHLGRVTASAALRVLVPPRLTGEPDDQYASPGSSVQFTCQAAGVPVPIISWSRNGLPIAPSSRHTISVGGISLRVQYVKNSDEGEYVCRAQNPAGSVEASASLYVREKVAPVIRQEPRDVVASEGQDAVTMPCRADGRPKPLIAWRKDGQLLRDDGEKYRIETDGALLVHNVTTDDAGLYECNAQNHVGFATARARLTVQEEEKPHLGDPFLQQSFDEAREQVDRAVNDTISQLFRRDRSRAPQPHELLRIFRFPSNEGREIARATEMIEQTLQIVMRHVESGMLFNLTSFSYQDLLSPEKVVLLTNLSGCLAHRRNVYCDDMCFHTKYRSDDGTCNNLRHPLWGASLTGFRRVLNPIYENGFNTPVGWSKTKRYHGFFKPSARLVSTRVISTEDVSPDHHCTHMLMQWGQFLDHDIDHALPSVSSESFHDGVSCQRSCDYAPPCFPIEIPPDDPRIRHHRCMEFTRSSGICGSGMTSVFYDTVLPREQINQLTSFIDGSQVYGSSSAEVRLLRNLTHNHGQLRHGIFMSGKPMMPFSNGAPVDCRRDVTESGIDCFLAGDIRANEQSGLTAMHNIWFREHNRVARALREINPGWDGDTIYYESRKIVGAEMQHITYQHWMQHILGPRGMEMLGEYSGYNSNINPTISNVFATAAYRFGHSLINPILHRLNATFQPIPEGHLPLHKAFFSPWRIVQEGGIDPLLRGLFATPAKLKTPGQFLNTELTEKLFRAAHEVALDLASLNIQRGRDHALPGYAEWRRVCNLTVPEDFDDLSGVISSLSIRDKLKQLYGHPGNVDLWVGGLLEDPVEGARVGPTFLCLLVDQFKRLREGDRFWYENPGVFKPEQLAQIKQVTLGRVLCDNGDNITDITSDVFVLPREQNPAFVPCSKLPYVDLRIWSDCCSDCRSSAFPNSITHVPTIRFRRRAQFSHREDREHLFMDLDKVTDHELKGSFSEGSYFAQNATQGSGEGRAPQPSPKLERTLEKSKKSGRSLGRNDSEDDLGTYEEDLNEQRIEGIEALVEQLSRTVLELSKKVATLEDKCGSGDGGGGGGRRKSVRQRRKCVDETGRHRARGESWQKDPCAICSCRRGKVHCRVKECPRVTCDNPRVEEGECCPECDDEGEDIENARPSPEA